jgi:alkanesulfonate monooxygenase SsuD/methylene tetrahydromethanopterin reductase-like flavin-dependent oxidoreductase (luciferase family)
MEQLEEQLQIVRALWSTPAGETCNFRGAHYEIKESPALPRPTQQPRPPIIVGGAGARRTPKLAARYADEFNLPFHPLSVAAECFDRVRAACDAVGRDSGELVYSAALTVCCGADAAEIERRAARIGRPTDRINVAGTPAEVVDQLQQWGKAGASRAYLQVLDLDDLDHVHLLAADVLPHV